MATLKQIEANRANALKSTGPKTAEGKAAVRLNSLQHGLRAQTLIIPGENREQFNQLHTALDAEWRPLTLTARFYVEQMAIAQWKLRRLEVAESSLLARDLPATIQIPLLDRLWQSQVRLERSFTRAQHELERIQGPLPKQPVLATPELKTLPGLKSPLELTTPPEESPSPWPGVPNSEPVTNWVCSASSADASPS